ncbi:UbiA prenyltransferase family-domain-containing protein [Biscogniauxia sp. FL1348]|nr:UbiA prenyltransferase family-domain-containing protein [Biscogniauxia sp. FL1348]
MSQHDTDKDEIIRDSMPLPEYSPPTSGILSHLPTSWVPFGELARIDRPNGFLLVYFPHLFGTLYAVCAYKNRVDHLDLVWKNVILFVGSIFSRAAICAWNDVIDREYDRQVLRCRLRPVARGAITPNRGLLFTMFLAGLGLTCLYTLPRVCWIISVPDMLLMALYPFTKRFMDFPQIILGTQLAMAVFMGMGAMDIHFLGEFSSFKEIITSHHTWAIATFYLANICWTIIYDTVYAQLDVEDDAKAGVRSMAVLFRGRTKSLLSIVSILMVILLSSSGHWQGFGRAYTALACGGTMTSLVYMLVTTDLNNKSDCLWWFKNGHWYVGLSIAGGLAVEWIS